MEPHYGYCKENVYQVIKASGKVRTQKSEVRDQNFSVVCLLSSVLLMEGGKYGAEKFVLSGFGVTCVIFVT